MAEIGRDLWVHQAQLLLRQAHPLQRAQDHVQVAFGDVQMIQPLGHLCQCSVTCTDCSSCCSRGNSCFPTCAHCLLSYTGHYLQFSPGCRQSMWSCTSSRKEKEKDLKYFPTLAFEKYWLFHCNGVLLGACSAAPSSSFPLMFCPQYSKLQQRKEKQLVSFRAKNKWTANVSWNSTVVLAAVDSFRLSGLKGQCKIQPGEDWSSWLEFAWVQLSRKCCI